MQRALLLLPLLTLACGPRHDAIVAQGTIEVEETDIVPTVRGRISRLWVEEGALVRAGDTVATLVSATLPEDLHEREARVARAEAEVRDLERGARPEEIARAEAELRSAVAEDARAAKELERMEALVADRVVSQQEGDNARAAAADARAIREAREQSLELLRRGATRDARDAAWARLREARAFLAQGKASQGELTLVAPVGGALYDRFGARALTASGMLVCAGALALLFAVMDGTPESLPPVMLALALFGAGQGLFISPNNSAIVAAAPASLTGEAGGLLNVMRSFGISVGVAAASSLLAWRLAVLTGSGHNTLHAGARDLLSAGGDVIVLLGGFAAVAGAISLARTSPAMSGGAKDGSG